MTEDVLKELDPVALLEDLPAYGLEAGDVGTVVFVHRAGEGYEVELMDAAAGRWWWKRCNHTRLHPFAVGRSCMCVR
ncbi:MAG: DUF4926 domain-containing protein [Chloroflexi bacterium]|nr:DUF4926 domain-containing protein [Chloroflexota bacterium]